MKDIYLPSSFIHLRFQLKLAVGVSKDNLQTVLRDTRQKTSYDFERTKLTIFRHGDLLTIKIITKVSF